MVSSDGESANKPAEGLSPVLFCLLGALTMAFGWGYRGTVGHEGGAMPAGGMLGMAICLLSGRLDWQRRAAVAGLLTAVGFAWGGSISYMEHPKYVLTDSFPDVLYGYVMLFFLGGIWAGIGGAMLGMALTMPRSKLFMFVGPFTAISIAYLATYLFYFVFPERKEAIDLYVARNWHDGEFVAALTALIVSAVYWIVRPKERPATAFIFWCTVGWWVGYGGLTKIGGIELAPPGRSEAWGGVLGILVATIIYLVCWRNFAALLLCLFGIVGGGLGFSAAVFLRHPVELQVGLLKKYDYLVPWKVAEEGYGFFMGIALALGALALLRGGLKAPEEDVPSKPLDVYAVFGLLIALMWINLKKAPMTWLHRYHSVPDDPVLGISPWLWYFAGGCMFTGVGLYALYLYYHDRLPITPSTAYGKATLVFLFLVWMPLVGAFIEQQGDPEPRKKLLVAMSFWVMASLSTWIVLAHSKYGLVATVPTNAVTGPDNARWRPGRNFWIACAMAPLLLVTFTASSMAMQYDVDEAGNAVAGPSPRGINRLRFGPNAYWRLVEELKGTWKPLGMVARDGDTDVIDQSVPFKQITFGEDNDVKVTMLDGSVEENVHRWWPAGAWLEIRWYSKGANHPEKGDSKLVFKDHRLYFGWPHPKASEGEGKKGFKNYLYLERVNE
jgi:hypothetical protein